MISMTYDNVNCFNRVYKTIYTNSFNEIFGQYQMGVKTIIRLSKEQLDSDIDTGMEQDIKQIKQAIFQIRQKVKYLHTFTQMSKILSYYTDCIAEKVEQDYVCVLQYINNIYDASVKAKKNVNILVKQVSDYDKYSLDIDIVFNCAKKTIEVINKYHQPNNITAEAVNNDAKEIHAISTAINKKICDTFDIFFFKLIGYRLTNKANCVPQNLYSHITLYLNPIKILLYDFIPMIRQLDTNKLLSSNTDEQKATLLSIADHISTRQEYYNNISDCYDYDLYDM